jgi:hypothetical protein
MDMIGNDLQQGMQFLAKKDPEGRNFVVLCLLNASTEVLQCIFETFSKVYDMRQFILKQEYDGNPSINMAMSLLGFEILTEKASATTKFVLDLASESFSLPNNNTEQSYLRFFNLADRLGRTCLHIACMNFL